MNETNEYIKDEVYKCSKCALCQSICPIYIALKNEAFLPRGRFVVLNNFFNNSKKLSKSFIKNLDVCLNCNLCKLFCPSNIDAAYIFNHFKSNYDKSFFKFSNFYFIYLNVLRLFSLKHHIYNRKMINKNISADAPEILFFEGCYNHYINSDDLLYSSKIINKLGYKVKIISACCGCPYINEGNTKKYNNNLNKLTKLLNTDSKYIVCSCDTCYNNLQNILPVKDKIIRLDDFLKINNYNVKNNDKYVYFKPLIRNDNNLESEGINLINRKGVCSLMENFFILKYGKYSNLIINSNIYDYMENCNKVIFTTCNLSKWGLSKILKKREFNNKVVTYSEYVYECNKDVNK